MKRFAIILAAILGLGVAYVLAHWALIEGRLWIVDDGGVSYLHGGDSGWMHNLKARPIVEVERGGETRRYRAVPVPGPHPRIHELLRAKYGIADRWVRFVGPDKEYTMPVRLDPVESP